MNSLLIYMSDISGCVKIIFFIAKILILIFWISLVPLIVYEEDRDKPFKTFFYSSIILIVCTLLFIFIPSTNTFLKMFGV